MKTCLKFESHWQPWWTHESDVYDTCSPSSSPPGRAWLSQASYFSFADFSRQTYSSLPHTPKLSTITNNSTRVILFGNLVKVTWRAHHWVTDTRTITMKGRYSSERCDALRLEKVKLINTYFRKAPRTTTHFLPWLPQDSSFNPSGLDKRQPREGIHTYDRGS